MNERRGTRDEEKQNPGGSIRRTETAAEETGLRYSDEHPFTWTSYLTEDKDA